MRIAILSDTHDNVWKLEKTLPQLAASDAIIHCGDLISPFMIKRLAQGVQGRPVHLVWGNNDGDKRLLTLAAAEAGNFHLHGEFADVTLDGLRIAVNHYPEIARAVAVSGRYGLVCYGHDHIAHQERIGATLLVNPGEVMGLNGRSTMALFDSAQKSLAWVEID